jgi:hypothetical protein
MRANGETWQQVAKALRWNASHLRRRALEDGYVDTEPEPVAVMSAKEPDKKPPRLGEQVEELARLGATLEQVLLVTGKSEAAILKAIKGTWQEYAKKCQLLARVELARAIFERAKGGDKAAFNRWQRGDLLGY